MAGGRTVKSRRSSHSAAAGAARALTQRLHDVRDRIEPAAKNWKKSSEPVHKLRVAARRGVAAIDLLEPLLPRRKAHRMRRLLQRIRRACDAARDHDVLIARIEKRKSTGRHTKLLRTLRSERRQQQKPIDSLQHDWLRSDRLARRTKKLLARVRWGRRDATGREPSYTTFIRRQLCGPAQRFQQALRTPASNGKLDLSDKTLHRLRIRGKRLRYALELAAGAIPLRRRRQLETMLRQMQDHLGEINDAVMARDALRQHLSASDNRSGKAQLKALLAEEDKALAVARKAFIDWRSSRRLTGRRSLFRGLV